MTVVARITSTEDFLILDEIYEVQPSFDDLESIDDTLSLDDAYSFDDTNGIEELISYLFDLAISMTEIDTFTIFSNGKLMINELYEVQPSFDDLEIVDDTHILDDTYSFDDLNGIEELISYLFDLTTQLIENDQFRIGYDGKLTVKIFTENEIL